MTNKSLKSRKVNVTVKKYCCRISLSAESCTSSPGGKQVDGFPPASSRISYPCTSCVHLLDISLHFLFIACALLQLRNRYGRYVHRMTTCAARTHRFADMSGFWTRQFCRQRLNKPNKKLGWCKHFRKKNVRFWNIYCTPII